jgi:biopolymer transport protein ExbD
MRPRSRLPAGVQIDMTPMIDIVFQLLAFFLMTLQITELEGDLSIQMPPEGVAEGEVTPAALPLHVALLADEQGGLAAVKLNGRRLEDIDALHREVERLVGRDPALAAETEARLACDNDLAYEHTIAAVTAVTGTLLPSGDIQPLASKVRFVPPSGVR